MILRVLAGSLLALGLGLYSEGAKAGQTFMCGDGRLLEVSHNDLERMKREDPCVAAHYGLTFQPVPLPVKRPPQVVVRQLKGAQKVAPTPRDVTTVAAAEPASSYRNVRIINPPAGGSPWFKHHR